MGAHGKVQVGDRNRLLERVFPRQRPGLTQIKLKYVKLTCAKLKSAKVKSATSDAIKPSFLLDTAQCGSKLKPYQGREYQGYRRFA